MITMLAIVLSGTYRWINGLAQYALDQQLHEIALHTPDAVTIGDLTIFALSLIAVRTLYLMFDSEMRRRDKKRLRRVYELLMPTPRDREVDAALADQLMMNHARHRPPGI
ncbi:hypothetical protein PV379_00740 [Streptomyces caniscabiei]|uniref:hypothetical protein n=1 Tax=Streptomyces caniscabiei TaxID=2746961 RepID=UPI0029B4168B|nr:hypothetical protein [Streptomyces caniscabiei]MDX2775883.1 hypothetical protein [Streptomyces caniscabiei]